MFRYACILGLFVIGPIRALVCNTCLGSNGGECAKGSLTEMTSETCLDGEVLRTLYDKIQENKALRSLEIFGDMDLITPDDIKGTHINSTCGFIKFSGIA